MLTHTHYRLAACALKNSTLSYVQLCVESYSSIQLSVEFCKGAKAVRLGECVAAYSGRLEVARVFVVRGSGSIASAELTC